MSDSLMSVKNLRISFHDKRETVAVQNFNLEIKPGEIVGLVGESGSGKSQSALAMAGLLNRHSMEKSGEVLFHGKNLMTCSRSELRQFQGNKISIIFQEPMTSLNPVKKIGWQVEESLRIHFKDLTTDQQKERAIKLLGDVGIVNPKGVYSMYPNELSGGMRQRVMIAAAMISDPEILIADEPTTALDVSIQAQIIDLLKEINKKKNTSIIFISHDLSLVRQICTRVLVMQKGEVVEEGESKEIFEHPMKEYTKQLIDAIPTIDGLRADNDSTSDYALEIKNVNAYYKTRIGKLMKKENRQILFDISMNIKKGEVLGLVGESGCGKTSLARIITGINKQYEGSVNFSDPYPQMVFQDPYSSLNPSKTIRQILEEPLIVDRRRKWNRGQRLERIEEVIKEIEIDRELLERHPSELSGGQRQRVSIGAAIMCAPGLLIADEAVSALDVTIQSQILALLERLNKEFGIAILFISHDMRVVYKICDNVCIMNGGRIIEYGDIDEVYGMPKEDYTKTLMKASGIVDDFQHEN